MDWTFLLGVAKDVAAIVGPIGLVVVAALGLGTWRRQLAGTAEFKLAKSVLTASYQVQDAIQAVRNPMLYLSKDAKDERERLREEQQIYSRRLEQLAAVRTELRTLALESRAVWGQEGQGQIHGLSKLIGTLHAEIWLHFWLRGAYVPPGAYVDDDPDRVIKNDKVVYHAGDDDEFSLKISSVISEIESVYQGKLRH